LTPLWRFLADHIGKPAPGLTLEQWAKQLADEYIELLKKENYLDTRA
jgi:hypothetical protein